MPLAVKGFKDSLPHVKARPLIISHFKPFSSTDRKLLQLCDGQKKEFHKSHPERAHTRAPTEIINIHELSSTPILAQ